ncbi:Flp pilus assembly protein TadB [Marmoricola sp. OAE513]|uniref:DUF1707 SHOCT-like domain-containing protein n=1 Tax=Marmoricola sp. OAE513 TaxID=2817894 RepID=UPI001AE77658
MHTFAPPSIRLSDRDRRAALRGLAREHRRGRIDAAELAERTDAVKTARTHGDLEPVFADLAVRPRAGHFRRGPVPFPFPFPVLPLLIIAIVLAATGHVPWIALVVVAAVLVLTAPLRWRHRARWAC